MSKSEHIDWEDVVGIVRFYDPSVPVSQHILGLLV